MNLKKTLLEIFTALGLAVVVYLLLYSTVQNSVVDGSSMLPGLENGQRLIVNKVAFLFSSPQRGEVVILHPPAQVGPSDKQWVKRIIGMPGDIIRVNNGVVYVNGIALNEPYIKEPPRYTLTDFKVPSDNYFVMGDNRNNSEDSRWGWFASRDKIIGRAWISIWPPSLWGAAPNFKQPTTTVNTSGN